MTFIAGGRMLSFRTILNGRVLRFPLQDETRQLIAGTLPESDIYLPYKGVSRRHFSVYKESDEWRIKDLGSTNGTILNGKKINEANFHSNDVIQAGSVRMEVERFELESEMISIAIEESTAQKQVTTEDMRHVAAEHTEVYSFPNLTFPHGTILGTSGAMFDIYQRVQASSQVELSILLVGETGSGKEVLAQTIHLSSRRSNNPFVAVNCAMISGDLVEAELFGIGDRVATGVAARKGKMVIADGGTLFLDELSAFPIEFQARILRVLEEKVVFPVGEHQPVRADFRLVAATNEDPQDLIKSGKLRSDLYHRIAGVELRIPPLRERKDDLQTLIPGILQQLLAKDPKNIPGISRRLFEFLSRYEYPGNVRELRNLLSSLITLAHPGELLDIHLLPQKLLSNDLETQIDDLAQSTIQQERFDLHATLDRAAHKIVLHTLERNNYNIAKTAEFLNMSQFGLRKMMKRLKIAPQK
jgi:arginine utilization regulatory protein